MSDRVLRAEVEALRTSLEALPILVQEHGERIEVLEGNREEAVDSERHSVAEQSVAGSVGRSSGYSLISSASARPVIATSDAQSRLQLAHEIGDFVRRALQGDHRGSSGRDRLRLASRCYLIFADFGGVALQPPRCVSVFSDMARICKRGNNCGDSVFVGVPTQWEAKAVVERAGFTWPLDQ